MLNKLFCLICGKEMLADIHEGLHHLDNWICMDHEPCVFLTREDLEKLV